MSITKILFPPANRQAALVAFFRTAWQTIRATGVLATAGGITITAGQIANVDWTTVGYTAAAVVASGVLSGGLAFVNVLGNGLPATYTAIPTVGQTATFAPPAVANPAPIVATVETVAPSVPDVSSPVQ